MNKIDEKIKSLSLEISLNEEVSKEMLDNSRQNEIVNDFLPSVLNTLRKSSTSLELEYTISWMKEMEIRNVCNFFETS